MANLTQDQIDALNIKEGDKITIIKCGPFKMEIKIRSVEAGRIIYTEGRKRTKKIFTPNTTLLLFKGWDIALKIEGEEAVNGVKSVLFDFNINLSGTPKDVKKLLEATNFNTAFDAQSEVFAVIPHEGKDEERHEVYPTE